MSAPDGLALVRAVREALSTKEGRAVAREIAEEIRRAEDEAEGEPAGYADQLLTRARRVERRRRRGAGR